MQQVGEVGFDDMLRTYGGIAVLNPPYIVCYGDIV